jgi:hypothetical protein
MQARGEVVADLLELAERQQARLHRGAERLGVGQLEHRGEGGGPPGARAGELRGELLLEPRDLGSEGTPGRGFFDPRLERLPRHRGVNVPLVAARSLR